MKEHIPALVTEFAPFMEQYGYWGVGGLILLEDFGLPVPGETVLVVAAFYAGLGDLNILLVFLVGFIAAIIGDNIGFSIGRYGGVPLVRRFGKYVLLTPARFRKLQAFFERNGGRIVIVARLFDGLRQLNGIVAGTSSMRWPRFLLYNVLGAALWVGLWSVAGYVGGNHIDLILRYQLYISLAVIAAILVYVGYRVYAHFRQA